jgi:hypothetical protein
MSNTNIEYVDVDRLKMSLKVLKETAGSKEDTVSRCERALKAMEGTTEVITAMTATLEKWNGEVQRLGLDYDQIPSSIIDHVDGLVAAGKIANYEDIIRLFEDGELKGIITDAGVDRNALTAFESKHTKKPGKPLSVEDDIF